MAWPEILSFIATLATLNGFFLKFAQKPLQGSQRYIWAWILSIFWLNFTLTVQYTTKSST